jgi:hypothetical protein
MGELSIMLTVERSCKADRAREGCVVEVVCCVCIGSSNVDGVEEAGCSTVGGGIVRRTRTSARDFCAFSLFTPCVNLTAFNKASSAPCISPIFVSVSPCCNQACQFVGSYCTAVSASISARSNLGGVIIVYTTARHKRRVESVGAELNASLYITMAPV